MKNFPLGGELSFDLKHQTAFWNILGDVVVCTYGVELDLAEKEKDAIRALARLVIVLRAEYEMTDGFDRQRDVVLVEDYAGIVGRLHSWPYFRAEVQSLTAKLGLPVLTLPVLVSGHTVELPTSRWIDPSSATELEGQEKPHLAARRTKKRKATKKATR